MSYHALAYKHKCKRISADPEAKKRRRLQHLDERIQQRLGPEAAAAAAAAAATTLDDRRDELAAELLHA